MNKKAFFDAIRSSVFKGVLGQPQVEGINAILASCTRNDVLFLHHIANVLAQVHHETGGYMLGIKETVFPGHTNKNPTDATVISRLDRAYAKGQLPWVRKPYWRDGWFGRGPVQITHKANYQKMGKRIGVDLVATPALALDPQVGADIAVVGMAEGMFTGKKLSDYAFPSALNNPPKSNPRRIVNGKDGTDAKIAETHKSFYAALLLAQAVAGPADEAPDVSPPVTRPAGPVERPAEPDGIEDGGEPEKPPAATGSSRMGTIGLIILVGVVGLVIFAKIVGWF